MAVLDTQTDRTSMFSKYLLTLIAVRSTDSHALMHRMERCYELYEELRAHDPDLIPLLDDPDLNISGLAKQASPHLIIYMEC